VKYAWMKVQRTDYSLDEMCAVLAVSESGYRAWKQGGTPDRTRLTDAQLLALKGAYGQPENGQGVAWTWVPSQQGTG
jgi:putative transposase